MKPLLSSLLALLTLAACSTFGGDGNPPWDTDIPESEAFNAGAGEWGPNGRRIVFPHSDPSTDSTSGALDELWAADLRTGERWRIAPGRIVAPDWSPDGTRIAFHVGFLNSFLWTVDAKGEKFWSLTGPKSPNPDIEFAVTPKWSPSGDRLLFAIAAGEPRGISIMNPDGSGAKIVVPYGVMGGWFPDGERIVYVNCDQTVSDPNRRRQIFVAHADGSGVKKLTDLPDSYAGNPAVSPDSRRIAFTHTGQDGGGSEVYLMNADGTEIRQVTSGPGIARRPEWHPDGQTILFSRFRPNVSKRAYLLDVTTLEVTPVFPAEPSE
jgi:TolB protein